MKYRINNTRWTIIEGIVIMIFTLTGFSMLLSAFNGSVNFGTGESYYFNLRVWIFGAVIVLSLTHLFLGSKWKIRIIGFVASIAAIYGAFLVFGGVWGFMDAANTGVFKANSFWILFSVSTSAYADLTVGLNAKLIADSICYLIPAFTLVIIIFQMLYAGEADEFIKAFIEGLAIIIFLIAYSLVGGVQVAL